LQHRSAAEQPSVGEHLLAKQSQSRIAAQDKKASRVVEAAVVSRHALNARIT
jgi:hypothetical protein